MNRSAETTDVPAGSPPPDEMTGFFSPPAVPGSPDLDPSDEFLNRELTWLEFNRRVLHEALDDRTPLLERVAFLAIFNSNLDEFYQKRVGGLKRQLRHNVQVRSIDGLSTKQQLKAIRDAVLPMLRAQAECFERAVKPALAAHDIHLLDWDELTDAERDEANRYFETNLFPVLTPLAVDPGHPFPFISNLSTSLGVMLKVPEESAGKVVGHEEDDNAAQFARVKVPEVVPNWVRVGQPEGEDGRASSAAHRFARLSDVIHHNLPRLFEGMDITAAEPFRITRNADVDRDEEDAEDLLELIEQELRQRRFASVVRLEVDDSPSLPINQFLIRELNLHPHDVYEMPAELDYNDLWAIHGIDKPALKYEPWTPVLPPRLVDPDASIFSVIRHGDLLTHHPYESFSASVERFIREACSDPDVVAIKLTLYRTAKDSPFLSDLIRAAEAGKQVAVLVELKARFDEERNVQLAQQLEKSGIHVVYGIVGYKTHTKTALVARREGHQIRTYCHIGTGNYHSKTANLYTDLGLFTCDERITGDLVELFHFLTGRSVKRDFKHLLIAPTNMRRRFEQMIDREIEHAKAGRQGHIIAKMNSLEDDKMIRKLYAASQAGVKIELIVRGFCCLRPGVKGMSENITVVSVIGRFLEHHRIYWFANDGREEVYIGSADWMYRNLNNRVEAITPIYEPALRARLKHILDLCRGDQRQAWDMKPDGTYHQRRPAPSLAADDPAALGTHKATMAMTLRRAEGDHTDLPFPPVAEAT